MQSGAVGTSLRHGCLWKTINASPPLLGNIKLRELKFKQSVLDDFGLPFKVCLAGSHFPSSVAELSLILAQVRHTGQADDQYSLGQPLHQTDYRHHRRTAGDQRAQPRSPIRCGERGESIERDKAESPESHGEQPSQD
jgi:hypothetical protein